MSGSISLFTLDLPAACEAWRTRPLDRVARAAPRGRVASQIAGGGIDATRSGEQAFATAPADRRRTAFDALAEDLAVAWLWDAPGTALVEALAALARLAGRSALELHVDAAQPAYPADLLDEPFIEHPDSRKGLIIWLSDPGLIKAGNAALTRAKDLPAGSFRAADPALWRDLLDGLGPLFRAARPGFTVAALLA